MNHVTLCGYLGKDFELIKKGEKSSIAKSTLAVSETKKDENGNLIETTNWIPIVIFGKKADIAFQYLKKGDRFLGEGKILTSAFQDQNGNIRYSWQVIIYRFEFVNNKKELKPNIENPPKDIINQINEEEVQKYNTEEGDLPF
ncbi:single-stranded DNA-binding protein [Campylobacter sp. W0049]|uniref:single-stranded DNA-binding protein n=1 Tax=Campylobacter molothri TaxID=1032242 RepID=UPI00301CB5C6|nr:single-stranded DNA-binding protein [Campylobacter sp. W0049]